MRLRLAGNLDYCFLRVPFDLDFLINFTLKKLLIDKRFSLINLFELNL